MQSFTFGGDLFFSGHTGAPFLLALMFWKDSRLRFAFLAAAVLFGAAVLLGHLHYSIDVFAAFFISYGVHDLARFLFRRDWEFFDAANGARNRRQLSGLGFARRWA
ncbi:sphingomyelin synthase family protein (plasmid) [Mesorhizobium sp. AR02]|nr:sphingomyelin synthase family protein [Mesorhizobium sp. AR02]